MRIATLILGLLLVLHACGPRRIPTLEPVRAGSGGRGDFEREIVASTKCAEVGETVTFTVTFANRTQELLTLTGTPLFDITLEPGIWTRPGTRPRERWSESDQYPANVAPVLQPGEQREYTWRWVASPRFAQQGPNDNNLAVSYSMGDIIFSAGGRTPAGSTPLGIGIGTYSDANGIWPCNELRRPWF